MNIDTTNDVRKNMPGTEKEFLDFLGGIASVKVETQVEIQDCPFVAHWKHKVDFVVENNRGERLYVEVKGWMSYTSVNELRYLLECSGENFYILQVTNEDWMGLYEKVKYGSVKNKIQTNKMAQYDEVNGFVNGRISAQEMRRVSLDRLKAFVNVRNGDLNRWKKMLSDRKGSQRI